MVTKCVICFGQRKHIVAKEFSYTKTLKPQKSEYHTKTTSASVSTLTSLNLNSCKEGRRSLSGRAVCRVRSQRNTGERVANLAQIGDVESLTKTNRSDPMNDVRVFDATVIDRILRSPIITTFCIEKKKQKNNSFESKFGKVNCLDVVCRSFIRGAILSYSLTGEHNALSA